MNEPLTFPLHFAKLLPNEMVEVFEPLSDDPPHLLTTEKFELLKKLQTKGCWIIIHPSESFESDQDRDLVRELPEK